MNNSLSEATWQALAIPNLLSFVLYCHLVLKGRISHFF